MKVCFHLHSEYSSDSLLTIEKIIKTARKNNISVVFLTDHNNLAPRSKIENFQGVKIIAGEEIKTREGEIIGIFLQEKIEAGQSAEETIRQIKNQGGIVVAPHPFDRFRPKVIKKESLLRLLNQIDLIEIFNSRNFLNSDNQKASQFAQKHNKIAIVGCDAHSSAEIKNAIIEMDNFEGPIDFLEKLKKAKFLTKKASPLVHLSSSLAYLKNKLVIKK